MKLRSILDSELQVVTDDLIHMAISIEKSIDDTIDYLKNGDADLGEKILNGDDKYDELEVNIEQNCVNIISMQQPVASDLRSVIATMKIVTDLERIADHCVDITRISKTLHENDVHMDLVTIPEMSDSVKKMLRLAVDCFIKSDPELAQTVCDMDDIVDDYYYRVHDEAVSHIANNVDGAIYSLEYLIIAKYLERMADHATNMAEWVIYYVTGKQVNEFQVEDN